MEGDKDSCVEGSKALSATKVRFIFVTISLSEEDLRLASLT